jgi:hypothetical protein
MPKIARMRADIRNGSLPNNLVHLVARIKALAEPMKVVEGLE